MSKIFPECPIQLVVGLANPGSDYAKTRHNAGAWLLEEMARQYQAGFRAESKFKGSVASFRFGGTLHRLLIPSCYMNQSGLAVGAIAKFYNVSPQSILIAHDELDFPPGVARIKQGGGHGGHNGLRSIIQHLKSSDFVRVRIGIGHPGDRSQVENFVLSPPSRSDYLKIMESISSVNVLMDQILSGHIQAAMKALHS